MAFVVKDRVREVTSSTGTGAIALGGAVQSAAKGYFRAFGPSGAGIANGDTLPYVIEEGANWEIGIGTYVSSGNQLQRTTVLSNSAGNTSAISLSGGAEVALVPTERAMALLIEGRTTPSAFHAHKNGTNQSVTVNVSTKITFGTAPINIGSHYNTSNSRWTPPAGLVALNSILAPEVSTVSGDAAFAEIRINKNGSTILAARFDGVTADVPYFRGLIVSTMDVANGTDYYEVFGTIEDATGCAFGGAAAYTFFEGVALR
jgi:hypothetical protein